MRKAVRAIVIKDNKLLVMHRNKFGKEYVTLPGGRIERGESHADALARELSEETGVKIDNPRLIYIEHAGEPYGDQFIFLCNYAGGEPALRADSDEEAINKLGENLYAPGWLNINDLPDKTFVSTELKRRIIVALQSSWPTIPEEF